MKNSNTKSTYNSRKNQINQGIKKQKKTKIIM